MKKRSDSRFTMLLLVLLFSALMMASVINLPWENQLYEMPTNEVGFELFQNYWFVLLILGLCLAASLLGGIYLARMDTSSGEEEAGK